MTIIYLDKPQTSLKLSTDSLIDSVFCFIAQYIGNQTTQENIYTSALKLMDRTIVEGLYPTSEIYLPDIDLWEKHIFYNGREKTKQFPITIQGEAFTRLKNIKHLLEELDKKEHFHLNEQEILDYSSYMFLDTFMHFLNTGKSPIKFPSVIEVLQRPNLETIVQEALTHKSKMVFLDNKDPEHSNAHIGIKV